MKYNTIHIRPKNIGKGWETYVTLDNQDRVKTKTSPSGLGFYHYPRMMGVENAFYELQDFLIKSHLKEIARLEKSVLSLKKLSCPVIKS